MITTMMVLCYVIVTFVLLIAFGAMNNGMEGDGLALISIWISIMVWPFTLVLAIFMGIMYLPYWVGQTIRENLYK